MSADVRLSTAIMAHPRRAVLAEALSARHPDLDARVVLDPRPQDGPSALRAAAAAWAAVPEDATHHLVLQDDAVPCADFLPRVLAAVRAHPDASLSLFTEWTSITAHSLRLTALAGAAWAEVADSYVPSVALVLPAALAREFGQVARDHLDTWEPQDDVSLYSFLHERRVRTLCRVPTLVEHAAPASLTGNDFQGPRHSVCFADDVPFLPGGETLLLPDAVPFFSHYTEPVAPSWPFCALRRPAPAPDEFPWSLTTATDWIRAVGADPVRADAMARVRVAGWRRRHGDLGGEVLVRLWLTAFTVGMALALVGARAVAPEGGAPPDPFPLRDPFDLETALGAPVVRRSFSTLPRAALHPYADRADLERFEKPLAELMLTAVRAGHRHAREEPPR